MRVKHTARKSTGGRMTRQQLVTRAKANSQSSAQYQVWHPALTTAAEEGEEHLEAALEAEVEEDGELLYETSGLASCPHPGSRQPSGLRVAEVPASPFPPHSSFGIVPYAVWHGHHAVVDAYVAGGADVERTALVPVEPHLQVRVQWNQSERASMIDTAPARALQIAVWKRDTEMAQLLLLRYAADGHLPGRVPFLLDIVAPRAGTLFASKAGEWSPQGNWCFPPAFRAAVCELLLISHKYGAVRRQDGQLRWPFRTEELIGSLLPVMGRSGTLWPWVTRHDRLPGNPGSDDDNSNSQDGSHASGDDDSD